MSQAIPMGCLNGIIKMTLHSNVELANSMGSETNMTPLFRKVACRFVQLLMPTWGGQGETSEALRSSTKSGKIRAKILEAITKNFTMASYIGIWVMMSTLNGNLFRKCRKKKWPIV